jgi:tRNA G46 methylase TrmB
MPIDEVCFTTPLPPIPTVPLIPHIPPIPPIRHRSPSSLKKLRLANTLQTEQERLDLHHEVLFDLLHGKHHLAPLENPERILDIGTGTGIWAMDVAVDYPEAEVIGIDLRCV